MLGMYIFMIVLSSWWIHPFIIIWGPSLSLITVFGLKFILSDISVVTPVKFFSLSSFPSGSVDMGRNQRICVMRVGILHHVLGSNGDHVRNSVSTSEPLGYQSSWPPFASGKLVDGFVPVSETVEPIQCSMDHRVPLKHGRAWRRALSWLCYLASGLCSFLSFLSSATFFHILPSCDCRLQVSQSMGVAVRSGCEFQLFRVVLV